MGWVTTYEGDRQGLNAKKPTWKKMRLFKNNVAWDEEDIQAIKELTTADLTEADYSGYTLFTPAWETYAYVNAASPIPIAQIDAESHTFVRQEGAVSNDIYGVYFTDDDNKLTAIIKFAAPIPMAVPFDDSISVQWSPTESFETAGL